MFKFIKFINKLKKAFYLIIVLAVTVSINSSNSSAAASSAAQETFIYYRDIKVLFNGTEFSLKDSAGNIIEPFIMNDSTYVPLRAISELFGASVEWDDESSAITVTYDSDAMQMQTTQIGNNNVPLAALPGSDISHKLLSLARNVFELSNKEREKANLKPYIWDDELYKIAQARAGEVVITLSHIRPDGSDVSELFKGTRLKYLAIGENVGSGFKTAERMVESMMNSRAHRENILRDFDYSAVCVVECTEESGREGYAFAQIFMQEY